MKPYSKLYYFYYGENLRKNWRHSRKSRKNRQKIYKKIERRRQKNIAIIED